MVNIRYEFFNVFNELINQKENKSNTLIIHSSLAKLLPPENFNKWDALYTISRLIKEGYTIAFPSFTFSFCKNKFYSEKNSISESGIFADWVLHSFENSIRTQDPVYSFVIIGDKAKEYFKFDNQTSWGKGSIFEYFENINAKIITLGSGLESITQFHRYEEIMEVPYRNYKNFEGIADYSSGTKKVKKTLYVRDLNLNPKNNMNLIKESIKKAKSYFEVNLFRGKARIIDIKDLSEITKKELKNNKYCLVENANNIRFKINNNKEAVSQKNLRIALLGFNNNELLVNSLKHTLENYIPERNFDFYLPPYEQFIKELIDQDSKLNKIKTYIRIFNVNLIDIKNLIYKDQIQNFIDEYIELILKIQNHHGGWSIVNLFFNNDPQTDYEGNKKNIVLINKINKLIIDNLAENKSIILIDPISTIVNKKIQINDHCLWDLGRFPFSNEFSKEISSEWAKQIITIMEKKIRLIILDLDNTIWGGILGEEGITEIKIGGDYPGNTFYNFQKELVKLRSKGIALAISSKNNEVLVEKAFNTLKCMPLKWKMFSAKSIGWHEKIEGIKEISKKLNIGIYSTLFIDDNAAEIEKVKNEYPEIKVLHLPKDPSQYTKELKNNPFIRSLNINKEDLQRIDSFSTLVNLKSKSKNKNDLNKYLLNLKIEVFFNNLTLSNLNRAEQLCLKTNQFNSTTIRFTSNELLNLEKKGKKVIVIGHKSKDTDFENIGLMIIEENSLLLEANLKLYLLSCRVLGRGLEKNCIKWLTTYYLEKGFNKLYAELSKNEKNIPIHNIFKEVGFIYKKNILWELKLKEKCDEPNYIKIYNNL